MANIFTRVLDKITPWNRKGEVQRGQERKKKKEDEERIVRQRAPQTRRPQNVFEQDVQDVLKDKSINTVVSVPRGGPEVTDYDRPMVDNTPKVAPGAGVLTPEAYAAKSNQILQQNAAEIEKRIPKPQQSLVNKFRDVVDANTEADQYRRAVSGAKSETARLQEQGMDREKAMTRGVRTARIMSKSPARSGVDDVKDFGTSFVRGAATVPSALGRIVTGIGEGVTDLVGYGGTAVNAPIQYFRNGTVRGSSDNAIANTLKTVKRRGITPASEFLDRSAKTIGGENNMPVYKYAQTAGEVVGAVASAGTLAAAKAPKLAQAFKLGEVADTSKLATAIKFIDNLVNSPIKGLGELLGRSKNVAPEVNIIEDLLTKGDLDDIATTNIPVRESIPIVSEGAEEAVNVRNVPNNAPLIREVGGDARAVNQAATGAKKIQNATPNRVEVPVHRPDTRIEGVGEFPVNNKAASQAREILDDNLRTGKISEADHADLSKQLDEITPPDPKAPQGNPIQVKQVNSIPVDDATTNVPTNLPETPGTVRVTTSAAPSNAKSEVVAQTPTAILPKVGTVLPDGTKVTKRMVKAERENLKNAKKMAKVQEETAATLERINTAQSPNIITKDNFGTYETDARYLAVEHGEAVGRGDFDTAQRIENRVAEMPTPGAAPLTKKLQDSRLQGQSSATDFAPTGKFKVGKKGNVSEVATREAEAKRGADTMARTSTDDLIKTLSEKKRLTQEDSSNIIAALDNLKKANPETYRGVREFQILENMRLQGNSDAGRQLGLIAKVMRKTASGQELTNRWDNKIGKALDDPSKMSNGDLKIVEEANDAYAAARDTARRAEEQYKVTHSKADLDALKKAKSAEVKADVAAKAKEVEVANRVLKGSKAENAARVINDLEKEADLNMMDYVTAGQLSGPATGARNLYGTELAGIEHRVGANLRAKVVKNIIPWTKGENVGGFDRRAARAGRKEGFQKMVADSKRRASYSGWNPFKHARNFATTINSAGESSLHSTTQSRLKAYYKNQLKQQGVSGERLANDAEFLRLTDPDGMGEVFMDTAMKSSGLTGIYQKTQKIESSLSKGLADWLGKGLPPRAADTLAKGMVRIAFGYPTATANFLAQSGKRLMVGLPSAAESGIRAARGDRQGAALAMDRALKEAGSGLAALTVGTALANADKVTGFYPEDEDERQRWKDEGRSELSIKIGDAWHPIPQGFGMFGLPLIVASQFKESGAEGVADMFTDRKKISKLLPTDQAYGALQILSGDATTNQDKSFVASTIRSFIPTGSFLNQTAKGLDETANDTTTKDFWSNVYDQVITGIPIVNNKSDIPDKLSSTGEPIRNPNLAQVYSGAQSVEQKAGVENSKKVDAAINSTLSQIDQYGLLNDPNMKGVLKDTGLEALTKANAGRQLDESDIKALKDGLVKNVTGKEDTAYLEREQYDTNLSVLKLKRDLMKEDPTTKPSSLKDIDTAIKRGEIFKDKQIPYEDITDYKSIGVEDWRKMGDPEEDEYDPDRYQQLFDIDRMLADGGVSYKKGDPTKAKYFQKDKKGGRGGSGGGGSRKVDTDIGGMLKDGSFAPKVKEYEGFESRSGGGVPRIGVVRPNIVHKISSSG